MYSSEEIKKMNNNPNIPVEKSYELSDKEQALLDFIKTNEDVTIKLIELQLGATYVGALGKLISNCLVKSEKRNLDEKVENKNLNQYGKKFIKCYFINEEVKPWTSIGSESILKNFLIVKSLKKRFIERISN